MQTAGHYLQRVCANYSCTSLCLDWASMWTLCTGIPFHNCHPLTFSFFIATSDHAPPICCRDMPTCPLTTGVQLLFLGSPWNRSPMKMGLECITCEISLKHIIVYEFQIETCPLNSDVQMENCEFNGDCLLMKAFHFMDRLWADMINSKHNPFKFSDCFIMGNSRSRSYSSLAAILYAVQHIWA